MMFRCFLLVFLGLAGCVAPSSSRTAHAPRPFEFSRDSFAFANELAWEYERDAATGEMHTRQREPKPDYALHCFVLVRSARQFLHGARFDQTLPKLDTAGYRRLIRRVARLNPRAPPSPDPVVFPGYADLRQFSRENASLLKAELGGAWRSYVQRGNWRMIFPFTRRQQTATAQRMAASLQRDDPPVVHIVRFPDLSINHALLIFDAIETPLGIRFLAYDPNNPDTPAALDFRRADRTFFFPETNYFVGGSVDVYEIYRGWFY